MQTETILYQGSKAPREVYLHDMPEPPKTLNEAHRRIIELTRVIEEMKLREDVQVQGRVAAHLGIPASENPYQDHQDRGFSLGLIWEDAHRSEHEYYVAKDRLARVGELVIAACSLKNTLVTITKAQERAVKVFDIALSRFKEQTCR